MLSSCSLGATRVRTVSRPSAATCSTAARVAASSVPADFTLLSPRCFRSIVSRSRTLLGLKGAPPHATTRGHRAPKAPREQGDGRTIQKLRASHRASIAWAHADKTAKTDLTRQQSAAARTERLVFVGQGSLAYATSTDNQCTLSLSYLSISALCWHMCTCTESTPLDATLTRGVVAYHLASMPCLVAGVVVVVRWARRPTLHHCSTSQHTI
jgi:hypothetical protein